MSGHTTLHLWLLCVPWRQPDFLVLEVTAHCLALVPRQNFEPSPLKPAGSTNDEDMVMKHTTKYIIRGRISQVNSNTSYGNYYFISWNKYTTPSLLIYRITEDIYEGIKSCMLTEWSCVCMAKSVLIHAWLSHLAKPKRIKDVDDPVASLKLLQMHRLGWIVHAGVTREEAVNPHARRTEKNFMGPDPRIDQRGHFPMMDTWHF